MKFLLYICIIINLSACNKISSNSFKLEGFVEGAKDSENVILSYFLQENEEWREIADTTKIINGEFLFEGSIDELTAADLYFDNSNVPISVRIYLEPTSMKLRINKAQPYAYKLSGTKVEKENIELRKELESDAKIYYEGLERMDNIFKRINLEAEDNNILVLDSLFNLLQYTKEHTSAIKPKINKTNFDFILRHNMYRIIPDLLYLLTKQEFVSIDTIKRIYSNLPEQSKASLMGKLAFKQIEYSEREKGLPEDTLTDTLMGNPAPCFTRKDFSGKTIRLSDFKNKNYVLLDFWASWCVPCVREIPEIKNLYNKYREKGLTIISISSDKDSNSWLNAIRKYQLTEWPQILSAQNGNDSVSNIDDLFSMYNVKMIPHFILIDKQGKIIARWGYLGKEQLVEIDSILNSM